MATKTVLLLSGGLDSCVLLYSLRQKQEIVCLAVNYGQRHGRELEAAGRVAGHAGVNLTVAELSGLRPLLSGSALTDDVDVPLGHYSESSMALTVVPNRNAILLSVAAGFAISQGASAVAYAAHAGDSQTYPDCRPEFVGAMDAMLGVCHSRPVRLQAPLVRMSKTDIVRLGTELGAPLQLTWSCYKGGSKHCGKCGTCVARREAFSLAGVADPTEYEV